MVRSGGSPLERGKAVVLMVVAAVCYALLATRLGLAWPYPNELRNRVSFPGPIYRSQESVSCRSLAEWSNQGDFGG
jgi:hypothetical protein